tara:strand:+ start:4570 stop:6258 length:1689 start_codon:yes stop_codon:yes gene_type:complete
MLTSLKFENIALFNSNELDFQKGFTVITGETGAGKSILLDSLDILLGGSQRTNASRLLLKGKNSFFIEGIFDVTKTLIYWLNKYSIEFEDNEIIVSREWKSKDNRLKSRCRVNGIYINSKQLQELRNLLIDFTSQGSNYKVEKPSQQLLLLDDLSGSNLKEAKIKTKNSWFKWIDIFNQLEEVSNKYNNLRNENQLAKEILEELKDANLNDPNEIEILKTKQDKLFHTVALKEGLEKILFILNQGTLEASSVTDQMHMCHYELKELLSKDNSLSDRYDQLLNININVKELISSLETYYYSLESDPELLNNIQTRLAHLKKLEKRFDLNLFELIKKRDELIDDISYENLKNQLLVLEEEEYKARMERDRDNVHLSTLRKKAAKTFESALMKSLTPLGLSNVKFKVDFLSVEPSITGSDLVKFLFSANPGQALLPLEQVASGGEMSRFVLALKAILSKASPSKIFIFDEIDSGVSGRISKAVANLLKTLAKRGQVVCVTHQPLVAAAADHHFSVNKFVENGLTFSKAVCLDSLLSRQKELAELAGGDDLDSKVYAASLLEQQAA